MVRHEFQPDLDEDELTLPDMRGEGELTMLTLTNAEQSVGIVHRKHLGDLITKFGLQRFEEPTPPNFVQIKHQATDVLDDFFWLADESDPKTWGLRTPRLTEGLRAATGGGRYDESNYSIWRPTRVGHPGNEETIYPFVIESDRAPDEWLIHRELGSTDDFLDDFGISYCDWCEEDKDETFAVCPDCERIPDAVHNVLETMREKHPGVLVVIGSGEPDPSEQNQLKRNSSTSIEEAIAEYKEETGDRLLDNEDDLEDYLARKGATSD